MGKYFYFLKMKLYFLLFCLVACAQQVASNADDYQFDDENLWNCYSAPESPGDRRPNPDILTVVQYNVEWLFYGDGSSNCPGTGCTWENQTIALAHIETIANELAGINADIINLAEVEDCFVLQTLVNQPALKDLGYNYYLVRGGDTSTNQNVGLLTKVDPIEDLTRTDNKVEYPIEGTQCGGFYSGTYGCTKHYITRFKVGYSSIVMLGLHLIAFPDDEERCTKREASAVVLQDFLQSYINPDDEIIVLGDFNDYDGSFLDAAGDVPTSRAVRFMKNYQNVYKSEDDNDNRSDGVLKLKLRGDDDTTVNDDYDSYSLTNVNSLIEEQSLRYSDWYDQNNDCFDSGTNEHSLIDHMLVSPGLLSMLYNNTILHNYEPSCYNTNSDHWPVIAHFNVSTGVVPAVKIN